MNLLIPCEPAMPGPPAEMRKEEAQALDIIVHLLAPELVVESGTFHGGSACIFARHTTVITFDPSPIVPAEAFHGKNITQVIGSAPQDLPRLNEHVKGKRWLFFHDSVHTPEHLLAELEWAFSHGAFAAIWHDVALDHMLDALPIILQRGHVAMRVMDYGKDRTSWSDPQPDIWGGLGLAWNCTSLRQ